MISYYLLITTKENYEVDKNINFKLVGLPFARRKTASLMKIGDKIIYYIKGISKITGVLEVDSLYFEDKTKVWVDNVYGEVFPWRVKTKPYIMIENIDRFIPFKEYIHNLLIIKNPAIWGAYLETSIRKIDQNDYLILEKAIRKEC